MKDLHDPSHEAFFAAAAADAFTARWFTHYAEIEDYLLRTWDPSRPITLFQGPPQPEWSFGLTETFRKSIDCIDRKLQGRILEAVLKICDSPLKPHGDSIKPLTGELSGYWRCRIGDYRLIYKPDSETKRVLLVDFSARGSAYD